MNARFSLCANFNVITRPKDAAGDIYICSLGAVVLPHASSLFCCKVIDIHLIMSIIFANFTYPFRYADGLILTKISRYETDKIQTIRPCLALRQQDW